MRWFKHLTRAHSDESITPVLAQLGPFGYGLYWMICEVVGESMDKSDRCSLTHPIAVWRRDLYVSWPKLREALEVFSEQGLMSFEVSYDLGKTAERSVKYHGKVQENREDLGSFADLFKSSERSTPKTLTISVPKLLKYRDEYSSRVGTSSRETPETLPRLTRARSETETEADTEAETHTEAQRAPDSPNLFECYFGMFEASGKALNETDRRKAAMAFVSMPEQDQVAAHDDAARKFHDGTWPTPELTPYPGNHLAGKPWTRTAKPRTLPDAPRKPSGMKAANKTETLERIMRGEITPEEGFGEKWQ